MIQRIFFLAIGFLATAWPAAAQHAALHGGRPALQITSVDGEANTYIDYGTYEGETVFRFLVRHIHSNRCNDYLYVSRSGIQYNPEFSAEFWNDAFDAPWADIKEVKRYTKKDEDGMTVRTKKRKYNGCVPRFVEKERRPPLRHQSIISGGNLRVFENLAQTLVAVDAW